jgi:hypothetical protein
MFVFIHRKETKNKHEGRRETRSRNSKDLILSVIAIVVVDVVGVVADDDVVDGSKTKLHKIKTNRIANFNIYYSYKKLQTNKSTATTKATATATATTRATTIQNVYKINKDFLKCIVE